MLDGCIVSLVNIDQQQTVVLILNLLLYFCIEPMDWIYNNACHVTSLKIMKIEKNYC